MFTRPCNIKSEMFIFKYYLYDLQNGVIYDWMFIRKKYLKTVAIDKCVVFLFK